MNQATKTKPVREQHHESAQGQQLVFDGGQDLQTILSEGYLYAVKLCGVDQPHFFVFNTLTYSASPVQRLTGTTLQGSTIETTPDTIDRINSISVTDLSGEALPALVTELCEAITTAPQRLPPEELAAILDRAPTTVDTTDLVFLTRRYLEHRPETLSQLGPPVTEFVVRTDGLGGTLVLKQITAIAQEEPAAVAPIVDDLAGIVQSQGGAAVEPIKHVAEDDPEAVLDAIPALAAAADGDQGMRRQLVYTFTRVAQAYPEALLPTVDTLTTALNDDTANIQINALSALGRIASHYPDIGADIVDPVASLVEHDNAQLRGNAVGLLADTAQAHPAAVLAHAPAIVERLRDTDASVRQNAAMALNRAGRADPSVIQDYGDRLQEMLTDDSATVRATVCTLIGNAGVDVPAERLRELRSNDPDGTVREQAAYALSARSNRS